MPGLGRGRDSLYLLGVEHVPVADAAQVMALDLLLAGVLVLLADGELPPLLDDGGLGAFLEVPSAIPNLVEGAPAVVREPALVPDEPEVQAVAALVHRSGDGVSRTEGRQVRFHPPQPAAFHVRDDFTHHAGALLLHDFQ